MGLSDNPNEFVLAFIFWDHHVRRGMVLLIAHENVRYQWALAWQKCYGHLDGLAMPVFRVSPLEGLLLNLFLKLMQKSVFSTHTEVAYSQKAHFLQNEFTGELQLESRMA